MTSNHPFRRVLARICSPDTMARVVDPTLADIRWEHRRAHWRGYVSLASALALHVISSIPARVAAVWLEDGHAVPRVTILSIGAAAIGAAPLVALPLSQVIHDAGASRGWLVLTLVPQALVLTLPTGLLVAVPVTIAKTEPSARLIRRVILLSALYAGVTFGLIEWVMPVANQAYRVAVSGVSESELERGPNETPLRHIKREIERLRTFHGSETVIRRIEYEYELRLSLAAAAVPLGLVALACAFSPLGRRRPFLTGLSALGLYFVGIFSFERLVVESVLRGTSLPAGSLAWVPNAFIVLIAGVLASIAVRPSANRQSPIANQR